MSTRLYGLLAEFEDPTALVHAVRRTREEGYRRLDAFTPYPIEELTEALEFRRTRMPLVIFIGGVIGCVGGYLLQIYCNAWDYPPTSRISYRGFEYFRFIPEIGIYTHTVPPNYQGMDCGDTAITMAHLAARSYHQNGVNMCMADGSVKFVANTVDFTVYQAIGTRSGSEPNTSF